MAKDEACRHQVLKEIAKCMQNTLVDTLFTTTAGCSSGKEVLDLGVVVLQQYAINAVKNDISKG